MKQKKPKIITIFIAFNAAKTLENFYENFPKDYRNEIILVDDCSKDNTYKIAKKLGIESYRNNTNLGYGGNMKRALKLALEKGADIIIDIHPDGEYKPTAIPLAIKQIGKGAEFVLGNRFANMEKLKESGIYIWKLIPIKFLNQIDKAILGLKIDDFHQGFRVYTKSLLDKINFEENSNNYLFSFEIISQAAFFNCKVSQVPVETSYTGKKRGASLKNSIIYSLGTFKVLSLFFLAKSGIKISLFKKLHPFKQL